MPWWRTGPCRPPLRAADKPPEPLALTETAAGADRLAAVSAAAAAIGLRPGMTLADARALAPDLATRPDTPCDAARRLEKLAIRAQRFTPVTAPCGNDGLWLDITGCEHLFGGEKPLLAKLSESMSRRGYSHRIGLAETPGAAWALARFAAGPDNEKTAPPGAVRNMLAPLPMAALRLPPETIAALARVGLRRIDDLYERPRAPLARRFGNTLLNRLDQALGHRAEPIIPHHAPARHHTRRSFPEPVSDTAPIAAVLARMMQELCAALDKAGLGARRLTLRLFRSDHGEDAIIVGTSRARRDPEGLAALFVERLDTHAAGSAVEIMQIETTRTEPLPPEQIRCGPGHSSTDPTDLIDRLANRLGAEHVVRLGPRHSHRPDRAVRRLKPAPETGARSPARWPALRRPLRLFDPPQPITAVAAVPDGPPMLFHWRGRTIHVAYAGSPERIAAEWWREDAPTRDYYQVEDASGARFWIYREGLYEDRENENHGAPMPRWRLHGLFP